MRFAAAASLVLIYYQLDWRWLRLLVRGSSQTVLSALGHQTRSFDAGGDLYVSVDDTAFCFTAGCTYAALILMAAPFYWRLHSMWAANVFRLGALALLVQFVNLGRLSLALHLSTKGIPWRFVHDVPDTVLHYSILIAAVLGALKRDGLGGRVRAQVPAASARG